MTRVVADRVTQLRKASGYSQAQLGERMAELRPGWSRSTVVKLENYNREGVSVGDLLSLALALDVPPIMLIADPRHTETVPVADGLTVDVWDALLWLAGSGRINGTDLGNMSPAAWLIQSGWGVVEALAELDRYERRVSNDEQAAERARNRDDDRHRDALRVLRTHLLRIEAAGAPVPPVVDLEKIHRRARELGVDMPGMES